MALAPLSGCFYGLSRSERAVLNLRAGLNGQLPHSRRQTATRLGSSPRQVLRTEQRAFQKLNGLAQTDGCAGTAGIGVTVVDNVIGPAELAVNPALVAFGHPAYQALHQSQFTRLGPILDLPPVAPLRADFGTPSTRSSAWASQLLAIMLLVGLGALLKLVSTAAARRRSLARPPAGPARLEYLERLREAELDQPPGSRPPPGEESDRIAA
jgi:hypothetical protein